MQLLKNPKKIIKSTVVSSAALALTLAPTAAFAHGSQGGDNGGSNSSHNNAASQQQAQRNNWLNWNRNRQKLTCDQRQAALTNQANAVKAKDTQKLKGFAVILTGVQQTYSGGGVTVANYDTMNAQVTSDQGNATNAVNAITAPNLNCDDQNSAAAVSDDSKTFKHDNDNMNSTISTAQQSLSRYGKDLNNLFEAVINS